MMKTALHQIHTELNAKMGDFAGFSMPLQYESPKSEVKAIREAAGVFDVSHMGEFFVEGKEAVKFVDYMLPNEFKSTSNLKAVYSPLCQEDGGIIDDLIAYKLTDEKVMICVNASNREKDYLWFEQNVKPFDCTLSDQSEDYSLLALQGPNSMDIISKVFPNTEISEKFGITLVENTKNIIARTGYTGEEGFEIFTDHQSAKNLWNQFLELGVKPCGLVARDVLRLEACYPLYGHELNDKLTPLETGLKWTVKNDKSEFLGKEALLSREVNFRQIKLSIEKGIPREGYKIFSLDDKEIGYVSSGTFSPTFNKGIALGIVDVKNKLEDQYFIEIRNKKVIANRSKKPFLAAFQI